VSECLSECVCFCAHIYVQVLCLRSYKKVWNYTIWAVTQVSLYKGGPCHSSLDYCSLSHTCRVGQNRAFTPYMTVYLVISLPKSVYSVYTPLGISA